LLCRAADNHLCFTKDLNQVSAFRLPQLLSSKMTRPIFGLGLCQASWQARPHFLSFQDALPRISLLSSTPRPFSFAFQILRVATLSPAFIPLSQLQ